MTDMHSLSPNFRLPKKRIKDMAVFGLRKIFVDPAPRPQKARGARMQGFFDAPHGDMHWLPE